MKNTTKGCEGCMWYEKCKDIERCDYYTPIDDDETEEIMVAEYERNLRMRAEAYTELVEEQNS